MKQKENESSASSSKKAGKAKCKGKGKGKDSPYSFTGVPPIYKLLQKPPKKDPCEQNFVNPITGNQSESQDPNLGNLIAKALENQNKKEVAPQIDPNASETTTDRIGLAESIEPTFEQNPETLVEVGEETLGEDENDPVLSDEGGNDPVLSQSSFEGIA